MSEETTTQEQIEQLPITQLTAEIVGAYVAHHTVATSDLAGLIQTVGKELVGLGHNSPEEAEEEKPEPAVSIKRSVKPDAITCLLCGKPQKMLKRHLATRHELTPKEYKAMFGLKDDYPLVAPNYAAARSALAKKIGLGRKAEPEKPAKAPRKKATRKPPATKKTTSTKRKA